MMGATPPLAFLSRPRSLVGRSICALSFRRVSKRSVRRGCRRSRDPTCRRRARGRGPARWPVSHLTRAVQGIGAALAAPSTLSLISATFEEGPARNKALGIFTAVSAGGGSLGLVLGGALTSWVSWRWVLFINVPIGIAIIALAPRFVPEPPRNGGRLDIAGAALVTGGLAGVIYAFIRLAEGGGTRVATGSFVGVFGPLVLFGLGAGCCFLPLSVTILAGVPRDDAGAASGMLQTMQQTGAALVVAGLFIRPVRPIRATVPSSMEGVDDQLAPLALSQ
jgi:MFS family permease